MIALKKKDGGIRPIAVGCTLHRLVAKIAANKVTNNMSSLLGPRQLGFGIKGGAEAAVHAARQYLHSHAASKARLSNAFNSIRCDKRLLAVKKLLPELYPWCTQRTPLHCLYFGETRSSTVAVIKKYT